MVRGMQNYYLITTEDNFDCYKLNRVVIEYVGNRISLYFTQKGIWLSRAKKLSRLNKCIVTIKYQNLKAVQISMKLSF